MKKKQMARKAKAERKLMSSIRSALEKEISAPEGETRRADKDSEKR